MSRLAYHASEDEGPRVIPGLCRLLLVLYDNSPAATDLCKDQRLEQINEKPREKRLSADVGSSFFVLTVRVLSDVNRFSFVNRFFTKPRCSFTTFACPKKLRGPFWIFGQN